MANETCSNTHRSIGTIDGLAGEFEIDCMKNVNSINLIWMFILAMNLKYHSTMCDYL